MTTSLNPKRIAHDIAKGSVASDHDDEWVREETSCSDLIATIMERSNL